MLTREQSRAVIYGLACGDALGWPTEFMSMSSIWSRFGARGITDLSQTKGEFTDDTQMTVALAEGLLDALKAAEVDPNGPAGLMGSPNWVMPWVARRFVEWSKSPENNRAPGSSCMGGCRALASGTPWTSSGVPSKGCGAVMRVAPVGLLYEDEETLRKIAEATATCTHASEPAARSAHLGALAVRLALAGRSPEEIVFDLVGRLVEAGVTSETDRLHRLLSAVPGLVYRTVEGEYTTHALLDYGHLGQSWVADEALASALYCVCLADARCEGYREAVVYGANSPGDSDSIACIAGGIAGALWGFGPRGVPKAWTTQIEMSVGLRRLADRLADASVAINATCTS